MVVAVRVYKKSTPNGKVTIYLGKREFVDHLDYIDPIDGVIVVENDYLKGRKIYGQVVTTYRYGREEDEVMGVKFSKEMVIAAGQIVPKKNEKHQLTAVQEKLIKKLAPNAYPFTFHFPEMAPSSVILQKGVKEEGKPLGVEYALKIYVADNEDDVGHKRSTVILAIKKSQSTSDVHSNRQPSSIVSKGFTFSSGKINLEVTLGKEIYFHGEKIAANVLVTNNSRKSVRNIKVYIVQHCEITMVNGQFSKYVAELETREGCPITPGASFKKTFNLTPLASSNKDCRGIALDGYLKDEEMNLASSTLVPEGKCAADAIGIIISYSLRVKLNCGTLGGELVTDVPLKLINPAPGTIEEEKARSLKKLKSIEIEYKNSFADDDDYIENYPRMGNNQSD
ncbi:hypothetical protein PPYR_09744 [Photinus pyralis]|uniref:Phosrestin-1 n=1 Tax=Photinus pyralis TaxID=7054 RepID=A0A5N4AEC4_PHOPY|nr:arrestin homolog [Photinus pyralis]KAB0795683.1 hypothetical protein PPYR_09744 [Photinus pyralis]